MFQTVPVPAFVLALLVLGCAYGLFLRPLLRRRLERQNPHGFHRARSAIQPSAFQLISPVAAADLLMVEPEVQAAVVRRAKETGIEQCEVLHEARGYAREIVPSLSSGFVFRFLHGPVRRALSRVFSVRVRYADEAALSRAAKDSTPVFVLNHRSNLDYLIAATSLADRAVLSFAVGEWARYWPLEPMLRGLGGFFVRRGSGNPLYRAVLAAHVKHAARGGVPQAFFIEGRFSEDGALRRPRLGLLDYTVRAFDPDAERDVALVPVAVNYDRVMEDKNLHLLKVKGRSPTRIRTWRASLGFFLQQSWLYLRRRWRPFGRATISVGAPVSLRDWLAAAALDPRTASREARFTAVEELAGALMERIAAIMPILPVPLMAAVIREHDPDGITPPEAEARAFRILESVARRPGDPDIARPDWKTAVDQGLALLVQRKMVASEDGRLRVLAPRRDFVDYYANTIRHLVEDRAQRVPASAG